jgi:hypothetical protein
MKDDESNTILIGSTITFNENVRPKRFIGSFGVVESFGPENIRVRVLGNKFVRHERDFFYTNPSTVRVGEHRIYDPFIDYVKQQENFLIILDGIFYEAHEANIITQKQVAELHTFFATKRGSHVDDSRT